MKVLIVSATSFEIAPLIKYLDEHAEKPSFFEYNYKGHTIFPLVTGVGALNTAFGMARFKGMEDVGVAINVGLAGTYTEALELGEVVEVTKDRFADLGVEEADGSFTDVFDLGLVNGAMHPYENGWVINNKPKVDSGLQRCAGLTVNCVNGTASSIARIKAKYSADVESMEGAGFLFACRSMDVHHHQLRAISNRVEPRNKDNWRIQEAIDNLNSALINLIGKLEDTPKKGTFSL